MAKTATSAQAKQKKSAEKDEGLSFFFLVVVVEKAVDRPRIRHPSAEALVINKAAVWTFCLLFDG